MRSFLTVAGAWVTGVVLIAGVGGAAQAAPETAPVAGGPSGTIAWAPCRDTPKGVSGVECATVRVPVDWAKPRGPRFPLAIARMKATDQSHKIGSLLINPGGPGGSGVEEIMIARASFSAGLRKRFDIVGFDPRGVARSREVRCDSDLLSKQEDLLYPKTASDFTKLRSLNRRLGKSCRALTGPVFEHVDTASVVRDMDVIRAALGEQKISYFGISYGTLIGQQYAELFPARIRAMALDSNIDHSLGTWEYQKTQAEALEASFGQFADWCERTTKCALHRADVRTVFDKLYAKARAGKLVESGNPSQRLSPTELVELAFNAMYDPKDWFELAKSLAALRDGRSATTTALRARGKAEENSYVAVTCEDNAFPVRSFAQLRGYERRLASVAPHTKLNPQAWNDLTACMRWPRKVSNPQHRLRVQGAPPILMTNSLYDVATPYPWARNAASQIPGAVLLTYDGVGHADYYLSPCTEKAIDRYLLALQVPPPGTHCPAVWPSKPSPRKAPKVTSQQP